MYGIDIWFYTNIGKSKCNCCLLPFSLFRFLVSISLLFIAIGNGSSRACLTSLGAIQFRMPQQAKQLAEYFSLYYFVYYVGIFLSKVLPPMIRANTTCFNKTGCYSAVFGTLAISFFIAWCMFFVCLFVAKCSTSKNYFKILTLK